MTVTITLTDPTADESRAVRAYLDSLHGHTGGTVGPMDPPYVVGEKPSEQTRLVPEPDNGGWAQRTVTVEVTAEDAGAPDFDSAGMPWDERIHASSRATVADGTWRKKRGVSDELVAEVEQELRADPAVDLEATEAEVKAVLSAPEVPEAPVVDHITADDMAEADYPVVTPAATDAPPPPPAAPANPFLTVMSRIGKSKLDKAKKDELLTAAGALDEKGNPSILVLNKRPELIEGFVALLDSEGV